MEIRELSLDELHRAGEIDVSERGEIVYVVEGREIVATPEVWERPPDEGLRVARWADHLKAGGTAFGAFKDDRMVGIAVFRPGIAPDMGQLAALFIDRAHRRTGIARRLLEEVVGLARARGDRRLYVSAAPSESAVGFYRAHGFELADEVDPGLFELEPEDVHLIRRL